MDKQRLIDRIDAVNKILEYMGTLEPRLEGVRTSEAQGRLLGEALYATETLPPRDKSAMDGYAIAAGSGVAAGHRLTLVGEVPMGAVCDLTLTPGQAIYIPTGGLLPEGADTVVKIEDTTLEPSLDGTSKVVLLSPSKAGDYLIFRGEECRAGDLLLERGVLLTPSRIALLALMGVESVQVVKKPRIGLLTTGDELVDPFDLPELGEVKDINGLMLKALLEASGAELSCHKRLKDDESHIETALLELVACSDLVISSGASSAGKKDCLPGIIERHSTCGLLFHGMNVKPGKPVAAGFIDGRPVVALPGNPVSTYMSFLWVAQPILEKMGAFQVSRMKAKATLTEAVKGVEGKETWFFATLTPGVEGLEARVLRKKSGLISMVAMADACFFVEPNQSIEAGSLIECFHLQRL